MIVSISNSVRGDGLGSSWCPLLHLLPYQHNIPPTPTPLYLDIDQINCNPLYEIFPKKLIISDINFIGNLEKYQLFKDERLMLKKYCTQYFEKLNPKIIKNLLDNKLNF